MMKLIYICVVLFLISTFSYDFSIWPLPTSYVAEGEPLSLADNFNIVTESKSEILSKMIDRYTNIIGKGDGDLTKLNIIVADSGEYLGENTDYRYKVTVHKDVSTITANTIYGAMYGLESFSQLFINGKSDHNQIEIIDEPKYIHRGILIDTGRRFFPVKTVKELLDGMSYLKMNVLHWHLTDWCRVSLESKIFPMLTAGLVDLQAGHYTQEEAIDIVQYAKERGIRVIPEFDVPGHSKCWGPLSEVGMEFCDDRKFQIYGDPNNNTFNVLTKYLDEVMPIFPDEFIHFGCDELSNTGKCNPTNFAQLERNIFEYVHNKGKRPIAFEEALYTAGSAYPYTLIDSWQAHTASETISKGYDSIEATTRYLYLDHVDQQHQWLDLVTLKNKNLKTINSNINEVGKFYGGEVSMWSDNYCYIGQCGTSSGKPVGYQLYDPKYNEEFHQSILSLIFPRTIKAAGSFWRFDSTLSESSTEFIDYMKYQNDRIRGRGITTCPNDCKCNELTKCGKPYLN